MGKPLTEISEDTESGIVRFKFRGGAPSGITVIQHTSSTANTAFYSLEGINKGKDWNALPKGIYVKDGKKVVKH